MFLNKAALIVNLACATGMTFTSAKTDSEENHFLRKSDPGGALTVDAAIPESRKLPSCTTTCDMTIAGLPVGDLPGWPSGIRAEVDIRYGTQNLLNGDHNVCADNDIQWRLDLRNPSTSTNYFETPYRTLAQAEICSTGIEVTSDDYCTLTIPALPDATGWGDVGTGNVRAELDIRYGPQNLVQGDVVLIPADITIQWRMDLRDPSTSTDYFETPYRTLSNACASDGILVTEDEDYCEISIGQLPQDVVGWGDVGVQAEVDIRYGPQNLRNGDTVLLPMGSNKQWRLDLRNPGSNTNYFETPYRTLAAQDICYGIRVTGMDQIDYCEVSISGLPEGDLPGWPSGIRAEVDIRYGPQNLRNGDKVLLPVGSDKQWRLDLRNPSSSTNYFETPYRTLAKEDLCTTGIVVTSDDYCTLTMPALPDATGWGGVGTGNVRAEVDIRYGPQDLVQNDEVLIPADINIQWRMDLRDPSTSTNYFETPYRTLSDACASSGIQVTEDEDYCNKVIDYALVGLMDIRYGPQGLSNGDDVLFPVGEQVQYRTNSGSWSSTVTIGCPPDGFP